MSDQLYKMKSKDLVGAGEDRTGQKNTLDGAAADAGFLDFEIAEKVQKDKMVELLKRNHDVMMEKYETYRVRNEGLEKKALEKENLYVVIKSENDNLAN